MWILVVLFLTTGEAIAIPMQDRATCERRLPEAQKIADKGAGAYAVACLLATDPARRS